MSWQLLYWPLAIVLLAAAQGLLMPAIRRTPLGFEAKCQSFALHGLLTVGYFLPLVLLITYNSQLIAYNCIAAVLSRLLLFDPVLSYAAGDKVFAVGSTARTDKALRWLAARLSWPPERVWLVVWVVSLLATGYLLAA